MKVLDFAKGLASKLQYQLGVFPLNKQEPVDCRLHMVMLITNGWPSCYSEDGRAFQPEMAETS